MSTGSPAPTDYTPAGSADMLTSVDSNNITAADLANQANQIADTISSTAPPSNAQIQALGTFVYMVIVLVQSLIVGSEGMMARSQAIGAISASMSLIDNSMSSNEVLQRIPQVQYAPGSTTQQINQGQITQVEQLNKITMQLQMVQNLVLGTLQQSAQTQTSDSNAAIQSLTLVVGEINSTLQTIKDSTFAAAMIQPPSGAS